MKTISWSVFLFWFLLASACTYHGTAQQTFQPRLDPVRSKIPLRVAILQTTIKPFAARGGGHGVEIDYSEALAKGLVDAFSNAFREARLVSDPSAVESGEMLVQYDSRYRELGRNEWTGHYVFRFTISVQFKESVSRATFAQIEHTDDIHYSPSAEATAASMMTGASLFLLAPITIPWTTSAVGREAARLLEQSLHNSIEAIAQKAMTDSRLAGYAQAEQGGRSPKVSASVPTMPEASQPPSKYEDYLNSVVVVRSSRGLGSGFFVGASGLVVTNFHVLGGDSTVSIRMRNGRIAMGTVLASDEEADLVLLSVPIEAQFWLTLADPTEGGVGADVIAIGTPEGLSWSVSKGIVSAIRDVESLRFIQTDAPINSGNSGGPLILLESGKVVGVNTFKIKKSIAEGLGFAVSAESVRKTFPKYLGK